MEQGSSLRAKRNRALIAVCTLGLSEAKWKMQYSNAKDADKGTSFQGTIFGFIFKGLWFVIFTLLTSAIMWVVNIFKLIYYSIELSR